MKSKYLLLFSVALILMISTFVLAQDKRNNKVKPDKARVEKEKEIPGKGQLNKKKEGHIKKGNDKAVVDEDNNFKYYRDYAKGKKVEICHTEGDENVTISINENALSAHMAHGDVAGPCVYNDEGEPDDFIIERRNVRSKFYSTAVEAEDLIDISNRRIATAREKIEAATQRITILRNQPTIDEEVISKRENAVNTVQQLIQELEQQVSNLRLQVQQDRQVMAELRVD